MSAEMNADTRGFSRLTWRPHRVTGDADDPVLLAEQIQRLDGFFGETDDPAGRELAHAGGYDELSARCHHDHYPERHCLV